MVFVHDVSWVERDNRKMWFTDFSTILESTDLVDIIHSKKYINPQTVMI